MWAEVLADGVHGVSAYLVADGLSAWCQGSAGNGAGTGKRVQDQVAWAGLVAQQRLDERHGRVTAMAHRLLPHGRDETFLGQQLHVFLSRLSRPRRRAYSRIRSLWFSVEYC